MVYRKKPEKLYDTRPVLDAMGRCRGAIRTAQDSVVPFGPTFDALETVRAAIDACARFLTGSDIFYAGEGAVPITGNHRKWEDSGSAE